MNGLRMFSSISGLVPNENKSLCFLSGVDSLTSQQILSISGFQLGSFPITYLGLPLLTSSPRAIHCQPLIAKLCAKIEVWTAKFLSFAGRLILIQVILHGIITYWSMYLFLHDVILKRINSILFKYLWGGYYKNNGRCHYKVKWHECCHPKNEGGLGIRNIFEWNQSAVVFQLWRLIQPGANSIWVQWFNKVLMKNKGIWTAKVPYSCSWGVKRILNCRDQALDFIRYHISQRSSFRFWLDPWIRNRPLLLQYEPHIVDLFASHPMSQIQDFQHEGTWHFPPSNHIDVRDIHSRITSVPICSHDHITWDGLQQHNVSVSTIWHTIRNKNGPMLLHDVIWNSFSIPKCSFTLWTALKNRLLTRDRMLKFQMQTPSNCLLCNAIETVKHLFTECPYFQLVRRACPIVFSNDWSQWESNGRVGIYFTSILTKGRNFLAASSFLWLLTWFGKKETIVYIIRGQGMLLFIPLLL